MATIGDLVDKTRQMVWGGLTEPLNLLADDYTPGSGVIKILHPRLGVAPGALACVGLNTFYVMAVSSDGQTLQVLPSADGGPDEAHVAGEVVRLRPRATTWSIFREIHDAIADMSSPRTGLFWMATFESAPNHSSDMYPLPQTWWDASNQPQRMIRARWEDRGSGTWTTLHTAEWQVERYAVRIFQPAESAARYEFTFAWPFLTPSSLDDDLFDLGLTEKSTQDIPPLRAAGRLALTAEGRRNQPFSQGDSRRPEEVPMSANTSVSREFMREYREAVMAERTRLQGLFEFEMRIGDEP